ncbi:hypothetical protein N0V90_002114 [Kalmusia sp. IMI 367209]|nr:hypothetical protein N0V90_002114 [Kalmusia sp. IMI 367209]
MSDMEKTTPSKANSSWTDKERLVYLIGLLEANGVKLDFKNAPRPNGRSEIACERMIGRLKTAYKSELEALKAGQPFSNDASTTPKATPKRAPKGKGGDGDGVPKTPKRKDKVVDESEGSPKKRVKNAVKDEVRDEVKDEVKLELKEELDSEI